MSLDFRLHWKTEEQEVVTKVRKILAEKLELEELILNEDVIEWHGELKSNPGVAMDISISFTRSNWELVFSTYDYDPDHFAAFKDLVSEIAKIVGAKINDPQLGGKNLSPQKFKTMDHSELIGVQAKVVGKMDDILAKALGD